MNHTTRVATVLSIAAVMCMRAVAADACELTRDSPWSWTDDQLVARTPSIVVGRVVSMRSSSGAYVDYQIEVVEAIKGIPGARMFWLERQAPGTPKPAEWAQPRGRAIFSKDCRLRVSFIVGQQYLIFVDSFHPRGYELVIDKRDPWLASVRRLVAASR